MKNTINFKNKLYIGGNIDILQELYEQNGEFVDMIFEIHHIFCQMMDLLAKMEKW